MPPQKFGTVLGEWRGVKAYSSDYKSADDNEYPTRRSYIGNFNGLYCGYRYQCVEFSRRCLIQLYNITYGDVGMAYEIFDTMFRTGFQKILKIDHDSGEVHVRREPAVRCSNGSLPEHPEWAKAGINKPQPGMLMIWNEGRYFRHTGHVAVVTEFVLHDAKTGRCGVRVIEQNVSDDFHPNGREYARELPGVMDPESGVCTFREPLGGTVKGWISPLEVVKHLFDAAEQKNEGQQQQPANQNQSKAAQQQAQQQKTQQD